MSEHWLRDPKTKEIYFYSVIDAVCFHCMQIEIESRLYQSAYPEYVTFICYGCMKKITYDFKTHGKVFYFDTMDWSLMQ